MNTDPLRDLADSIRRALVDAAESAYEDAGIRGLCAEGRWEAAVSAMRAVDVAAIIPRNGDGDHPADGGGGGGIRASERATGTGELILGRRRSAC